MFNNQLLLIMEKKHVIIPSISSIKGHRTLPEAVVGYRTSDYVVRRISRPMRGGVRLLSSGKPIDWDEVYS